MNRPSIRPATPSSFSLATRGSFSSKEGSDVPILSNGEYNLRTHDDYHQHSQVTSPLLVAERSRYSSRFKHSLVAGSNLSHSSNAITALDPLMAMRNKPIGRLPTSVLMFFLLIFCFALAASFAAPKMTNSIIKRYVAITSTDAPLFKLWSNPTADGISSTRTFTIFNLTNPAEVLSGTAAPNYELLGPYCYQEVTVKNDINFGSDQKVVSYRYSTSFNFQPECSIFNFSGAPSIFGPAVVPPHGSEAKVYSESDEIVIPSLAILTLVERLSDLPDASLANMTKQQICQQLNDAITGSPVGPASMFVRLTVRQLLFGYQDDLLAFMQQLMEGQNYHLPSAIILQRNGSNSVPSHYSSKGGLGCPDIENDFCNDTLNTITIETTGLEDYTATGALTQWAGQETLWWWGSDAQNNNNGSMTGCLTNMRNVAPTDGSHFGPIDVVTKNQELMIFADTLWRTLRLDYNQTSEIQGLSTFRFQLQTSQFDNSPRNIKCFQQFENGVLNLSQPLFAPFFAVRGFFDGVAAVSDEDVINISFTVASQSQNETNRMSLAEYLGKISNDADSVRARESFFDVEPNTGITVQSQLSTLLLTKMKPLAVEGCETVDFTVGNRVPATFAPLFIAQKTSALSQRQIENIKRQLSRVHVVQVVLWAITASGALGCLSIVGFVWLQRRREIRLLKPTLNDPMRAESSVSINT